MIEGVEFATPDEGAVKATVHKSGKLGFTRSANRIIGFQENKLFKIGTKTQSDGRKLLILLPVTDKDDMTFEASKAGDYYYIRMKRLLRQMGVDYENETEATSFDIDEMRDGETKYFRLTMRKKKANNT